MGFGKTAVVVGFACLGLKALQHQSLKRGRDAQVFEQGRLIAIGPERIVLAVADPQHLRPAAGVRRANEIQAPGTIGGGIRFGQQLKRADNDGLPVQWQPGRTIGHADHMFHITTGHLLARFHQFFPQHLLHDLNR